MGDGHICGEVPSAHLIRAAVWGVSFAQTIIEAGRMRSRLRRYPLNGDIRCDFINGVCRTLTNGLTFHACATCFRFNDGRPVTWGEAVMSVFGGTGIRALPAPVHDRHRQGAAAG